MIREIYFKEGVYKFINDSGDTLNEIIGLNKVNIYVGANNSGKSRFIRKILLENFSESVKSKKSKGSSTEFNGAARELIGKKDEYEKDEAYNKRFSKIIHSIKQLQNSLSNTEYTNRNKMLNQLLKTLDHMDDNEDRKMVYTDINSVMQKLEFDYRSYVKFMNSRVSSPRK